MSNNRKYVILNKDEVDGVDFNKVFEDDADSLCYNFDGTKTFVKYTGFKPRFLFGKDVHPHAEFLEILRSVEWSGPPPE